MKFRLSVCEGMLLTGRAPQGARGLKFNSGALIKVAKESRPARGAWVEMSRAVRRARRRRVAPRKGRVG